MADLFGLSDLHSGPGNYQDGTANTYLNTGELRRQYNFGSRISELNISQDPFFRFLSMCAKQPTNDPSFKFTEERQSWHKRYGYIVGGAAWAGSGSTAGLTYTTETTVCQAPGAPATDAESSNSLDDTFALKIGTDYKSSGNIQNIFNQGNTNRKVSIGDAGTLPQFFLVDQIVKIPVKSIKGADGVESSASGVTRDYQLAKILRVDTQEATKYVSLGVQLIRPFGAELVTDTTYAVVFATAKYSADNTYGAPTLYTGDLGQHDVLEGMRSYVVGSAHLQGSGYPATWKDQPYSHGFGQTQIWKTAMAMDNTTRATELKYVKNEWARIWKQKLIEHKWDIEQDLLFGAQATDDEGVTYTQGAVDYVLNAGNIFSLDFSNKSSDDFLDDMCNYFDPRYNSNGATVFMCDTQTYNWLHKISGYDFTCSRLCCWCKSCPK